MDALRILGVEGFDTPNIGIIKLGEQRDEEKRGADGYANALAELRIKFDKLSRDYVKVVNANRELADLHMPL